jgi:hypothetical protein
MNAESDFFGDLQRARLVVDRQESDSLLDVFDGLESLIQRRGSRSVGRARIENVSMLRSDSGAGASELASRALIVSTHRINKIRFDDNKTG